LLGAAGLNGQTLISAVGSGTPTSGLSTGIYGLVFLVAQDTTIRSVGFFDAGGDGLASAHHIGIGSGANDDLWPFAVGTVGSGTSAPLIGGFRWVDLSDSVFLAAGNYYSIGGEYLSGGDAILANNADDYLLDASLSAGAAARMSLGTWPRNPSFQESGIYVAVNLGTQSVAGMLASAVPEPSTYAASAGVLALAGAIAVRRRRATAVLTVA